MIAVQASRSEVRLALHMTPPWRVAATTMVACLAIVIPLVVADGAESLVRVGSALTSKSDRSARISGLRTSERVGYDGQYVYFIALDPLKARYYMDRPSYRYGRILYPALAWATALGQPAALPFTMLALNVLAIVGMVYLLAVYLRRRGACAWWAAVYGFFPGLLICLLADLTEPVAYFFAGAGLLLFARSPRRLWPMAVLFALAALARETTLVFPVVVAGAIALRGRRDLRALVGSVGLAAWFLLVSVGPYALYRFELGRWLGASLEEGGNVSPAPFGGFARWPFDSAHVLVLLAVIVPGMVWLALVGWAAARRRGGVATALVAANVALFVVWLPPDVYGNLSSAARASTGLALAAIISLPLLTSMRRPGFAWGAVMLLTLGWAMVAAAAAALV